MLLPKDTESLYNLSKVLEEHHREQSDNYTMTHVVIPVIILMMVLSVTLFSFDIIGKLFELILLSTSIVLLAVACGYLLLKIFSTKCISKFKINHDL